MNVSRKFILAVVGFVLFFVLATTAYNALTGINSSKTPSGSAPVTLKTAAHRTAPDFTVYDTAGNAVRLVDYAGKPVVLNFWASWCPPCKSEMPHFDKLYQETKDSVVFLMVDLVDGQRETEEDGKSYVASQGFAFAPMFDTKQQAARKYSVSSIPSTFFINTKGDIVYSYIGAMDEKTLRAAIALIK